MATRRDLRGAGGPVAGTRQPAQVPPNMAGCDGPGMDPYQAEYRRLVGTTATGYQGNGFGNGQSRPMGPVGGRDDTVGGEDGWPQAGTVRKWEIGKKQPQRDEGAP